MEPRQRDRAPGALAGTLASILAALTPSPDALRALSRRVTDEIARGLAGKGGSLRMLPTFVTQPRGDETRAGFRQ